MRLVLFILFAIPGIALAAIPPAYIEAGNRHGVAPSLLYAIALTESRRPGEQHPWPWTANIKGEAFYFESRVDLFKRLQSELQDGNTRFDVGIMQINWYWNSKLFDGNLWESTDPHTNVNAGAKFLRHLNEQYGSYNIAVGAYHAGYSPKTGIKKRAYQYSMRVSEALKKVKQGAQHE